MNSEEIRSYRDQRYGQNTVRLFRSNETNNHIWETTGQALRTQQVLLDLPRVLFP